MSSPFMNRASLRSIVAALAVAAACGAAPLLPACTSSDAPHDTAPGADASSPPQDAGVTVLPDGNVVQNDSGPGQDCFTNPKTHYEIINACTDAQKIDKKPALTPGDLLPDGGLVPPS